MSYVDGFLLPLPKKNLPTYRSMARKAGKIWREHGALDFKECIGDDVAPKGFLAFPKVLKLKPDEVAVFSFIIFKSRAHRDRVNKKVMSDPRLSSMCSTESMPFDPKRMAYGGFKVLVGV